MGVNNHGYGDAYQEYAVPIGGHGNNGISPYLVDLAQQRNNSMNNAFMKRKEKSELVLDEPFNDDQADFLSDPAD